MLKNKIPACLLSVVMTLAVSSCMSLEKVSIANMRLEYDKNQLRLRGVSLPIGVSVITSDQKRLTTRGFSHGKLKWSNFIISVQGGRYSNGKIAILPDNPSDSILLKITSKHHPEWEIKQAIVLNHLLNIKMSVVEPVIWAPEEDFNINLDSYYDNGQVYSSKLTTNLMKKKGFSMEVEGGEFTAGKFHIFDDFELIPMHTIFFKLRSLGNPAIADSFSRMLNYIKNYSFSSSELMGWTGSSGNNGSSGAQGSDGERGGNGSSGGNGHQGEHGRNGTDLVVFADAYQDSILNTVLVYVEVKESGSMDTKKYLINPDGGNITVSTYGGDGGDGGSGGNGGGGGNGGKGREIKWEVKDSTGVHYFSKTGHGGHGGHGGDAGFGGNGGDGGRGGDIYIRYTERTSSYLSIIIPQSIGGRYGAGGSSGLPGSGGAGGAGNPNGSAGNSGRSADRGNDGERGQEGRIEYKLVDD